MVPSEMASVAACEPSAGRGLTAPLRCSANVSFLYRGVPLATALDLAAAAGFRSIELTDPFSCDLEELSSALDRRGLHLDLFNLPMGDFAAGERGYAGDPARREEFRTGLKRAVVLADRLGASKVNALAGSWVSGVPEAAQLDCLIENLAQAADALAPTGARVVTELLNPIETPGFLLASIDRITGILTKLDGLVGLQLDVYHLQRAQGELVPTIHAIAPLTWHVQVADAPCRTEPGTGEINLRTVLGAVAATGHAGLIGLEYAPTDGPEHRFNWVEEYDLVRA